MNQEQLQEIKDSLKETVIKTVNGKIDAIRNEQRKVAEDLKDYIEKDNLWKDSVTPTIEATKKVMNFASVGSIILKALVLIGAAVTVVWGAIKFFKK